MSPLPADPVVLPHLIGYAIAIFLPAFALKGIAGLLWEHLALDAGVPISASKSGHQAYLPAYIGIIERFLYLAFLLAGVSQFIAVWLAIKVAGGWKGWSEGNTIQFVKEDGQTGSAVVPGRHLFNTSILTSAISLSWALVGVAAVAWLQSKRLDLVIAATTAAFVATYGFWGYLRWWRSRRG